MTISPEIENLYRIKNRFIKKRKNKKKIKTFFSHSAFFYSTLPKIKLIPFLIFCLFAMIAVIWFILFSFRSSHFLLKEIKVEPEVKDFLTKHTIINTCQVNLGTNLFLLNTRKIQKSLLKYDCIENVSVKKVYPNKLVIKCKLRVPVAKFNLKGRNFFLDEKGNIFTSPLGNLDILEIFLGEENKMDSILLQKLQLVLEIISEFKKINPSLITEIKKIDLSDQTNVILRLPYYSSEVWLGTSSFAEKIYLFNEIWQNKKNKWEPSIIDMRCIYNINGNKAVLVKKKFK